MSAPVPLGVEVVDVEEVAMRTIMVSKRPLTARDSSGRKSGSSARRLAHVLLTAAMHGQTANSMAV